jgi:hypothetical protein
MQGIRINTFLKIVKEDPKLLSTKIVVYGDESAFCKINEPQGITFFKKDYEYSELKDFLKSFFILPGQYD